jgi:hypothetical protein
MPALSEAFAYLGAAAPVLIGAAAWLATLALTVAVVLRVTAGPRAAARAGDPGVDSGEPPGPKAVENLIVAVAALVIAGIAFVISFESVSTMAHGWANCQVPAPGAEPVCTGPMVWQRWPWALPIAIDLSIVAFDYIDLWLIRRRQELSWLRFVPRIAVVGTIILNVISAEAWGDRFAHALLLFNYAVLAHVLRHAIEAKRSGGRAARVDLWQWLLAPRSAYRTWRIMRLEKLSWEAATAAARQRALIRFWLIESHRPAGKVEGSNPHRVAVWLRARFSRGWSYVPADLRVRFRMREFEALGKVAKEIAARLASGVEDAGNGVAAPAGNGVAGVVVDPVSGGVPAVSVSDNGSVDAGNVLLLGRPSGAEWRAAAETLAVAEASNPEVVARGRAVAEALAGYIEAHGKVPSNADLGRLVGLSHTSAGNYKKKLRGYFEAGDEAPEAVGEG